MTKALNRMEETVAQPACSAWRLSNTLTGFCVETLEEALRKWLPDIFNTDRGVRFTGEAFIELFE